MDTLKQMAHRCMHITEEGVRIDAYPEYQYDHRQEGHDLSGIDIMKPGNLRFVSMKKTLW